MTIEIPAQPDDVKTDATTRVRGVTPRDLDREFANWRCAHQEAIGDEPVEFDEGLLGTVAR